MEYGIYNAQAGKDDPVLSTNQGWQLMSLQDLAEHRADFEHVYNNYGLQIIANFHSGNCCIQVKGDTGAEPLVSLILHPSSWGYQFPALMPPNNGLWCNPVSGYTTGAALSTRVKFYNMQTITGSRSFLSNTDCETNNNPGIFMRNVTAALAVGSSSVVL